MSATRRSHTRLAASTLSRLVTEGSLLAALVVFALPIVAQPTERLVHADSGLQVRVGGDIAVSTGAKEAFVLVVRGSADVAGTVGALVVVDGDARITGGTVGDLTVVRGRAILSEGAQVTRDVHLFEAELSTDSASRVLGEIERGVRARVARDFFRVVALIGLGVLIAVVLAGALGAVLAPTQVRAAGRLMTAETGPVLLTSFVVWLVLPVAAGMLIPTIVGLPLGIGYFVFVLPALAFLGVIVSGTWLGDAIIRRLRAAETTTLPHPAAAAALGITTLILIGRIPFIGLIAAVGMLLGSGAATRAAWRAVIGVSKPAPVVPDGSVAE
ncbi:MAG: hypothetical protein ACKVS7_07690 [Gemmatimonadaceae bacterium]